LAQKIRSLEMRRAERAFPQRGIEEFAHKHETNMLTFLAMHVIPPAGRFPVLTLTLQKFPRSISLPDVGWVPDPPAKNGECEAPAEPRMVGQGPTLHQGCSLNLVITYASLDCTCGGLLNGDFMKYLN
jgi:hypothetical protein